MKLVAVFMVVVLSGCSLSPYRVFLGDYKKEGMTSAQLSADRNSCSEQALKFKMATPATGDLSNYYMQKFMLNCMKERGYAPLDIHPDAFDNPLYMGKQ